MGLVPPFTLGNPMTTQRCHGLRWEHEPDPLPCVRCVRDLSPKEQLNQQVDASATEWLRILQTNARRASGACGFECRRAAFVIDWSGSGGTFTHVAPAVCKVVGVVAVMCPCVQPSPVSCARLRARVGRHQSFTVSVVPRLKGFLFRGWLGRFFFFLPAGGTRVAVSRAGVLCMCEAPNPVEVCVSDILALVYCGRTRSQHYHPLGPHTPPSPLAWANVLGFPASLIRNCTWGGYLGTWPAPWIWFEYIRALCFLCLCLASNFWRLP